MACGRESKGLTVRKRDVGTRRRRIGPEELVAEMWEFRNKKALSSNGETDGMNVVGGGEKNMA